VNNNIKIIVFLLSFRLMNFHVGIFHFVPSRVTVEAIDVDLFGAVSVFVP